MYEDYKMGWYGIYIGTLGFHARVISIYKEFVYIDRYLVKYQLILYIFYSSMCGKSARFRKQALYLFIFKYSHKKYMYNVHEQSENHHHCPVICQKTTAVLIGTLTRGPWTASLTWALLHREEHGFSLIYPTTTVLFHSNILMWMAHVLSSDIIKFEIGSGEVKHWRRRRRQQQ